MLKRVLYTDDIQGSIRVARGHESVATILMSSNPWMGKK